MHASPQTQIVSFMCAAYLQSTSSPAFQIRGALVGSFVITGLLGPFKQAFQTRATDYKLQ